MERRFERFTVAEIHFAQEAWANAVVSQDVEELLSLYDFGSPEMPLLFKPTLANEVRSDEAGARSYFVGGNPRYPGDTGFLNKGWRSVTFHSARGPILRPGGLAYTDMGLYVFEPPTGPGVEVDYTFSYHKRDGRVLISLHHSSLVYEAPSNDEKASGT